MAFGLTIGTERSTALQNAIQDELTQRGYSPDADPVMAEYITIMIINNKTPAQITAELQELIGPDFDSSFVDWLFAEAAKGSPEAETAAAAAIAAAPSSSITEHRDSPPHIPHQPQDSRRTAPRGAPGGGLYQQALTSALPSAPQKRTRSPSPGHANKTRRTDLPTGPRAMQSGGGNRSLLERMSGPAGGRNTNGYAKDDIQARIDNITRAGDMAMMGQPQFPMNGMDMNGMAPPGMPGMPMNNPLVLQEMMMNQMALMAQMAGAMGMMAPGQFPQGQPGFPMQPGMGMPGNVNMMNGDVGRGRGRGRGRGGAGRGGGYGRGGVPVGDGEAVAVEQPHAPPIPVSAPQAPVPAPQPATPVAPTATLPRTVATPNFTPPTRPASPTLCKFGLKCTNSNCRWSHPSPVATPESGVVLSNEACEKGIKCEDKDCVKAHVSPAAARLGGGSNVEQPAPTPALNPKAPAFTPPAATTPIMASSHPSQNSIPCRFGLACTRPGCPYQHPPSHRPSGHGHPTTTTPCRFGASCTRASCPFVHPDGRSVLPNQFHRGLGLGLAGAGAGAGAVDGTSRNKSMTFNKPGGAAKETVEELEKRVKEVEERKNAAEKAMKEAEAAAASKKEAAATAAA